MARHAYIALIAVQVFYGLLPAAGKTVFLELSPLGMTSLRILGGATVLLTVHLLRRGPWPQRQEWSGITVLALFGIVLNMGLFAIGLQRTHPVNATLLITSIPVFTYLIAVLMGKEGIGPRRLVGILLALSGALYLIGLSRFEAGASTALGDVLVLLNALSFSYFLVISKPWSEAYDPLALSTWLFLPAGVVFLLVGMVVGAPAEATAAGGLTWGWMAFIILGPTVAVYFLNATALRHVPSSTVGVFIFLQPPISALAAWLVLGQLPSWKIIPAAALILAGVMVVARRTDRTRQRERGVGRGTQ